MTDHPSPTELQHRDPPALCINYLWTHFDILSVQVRQGGISRVQLAHWAIGALAGGEHELLGCWLQPADGAMPWLQVFEVLRWRGVEQLRFVAAAGAAAVGAGLWPVFPRAVALPSLRQLQRDTLAPMPLRHRKLAAPLLDAVRCAATARAAWAASRVFEASGLGCLEATQQWRLALGAMAPWYALPAPQRRAALAADASTQRVQQRLGRALARQGPFADESAAATFLEEELERLQSWLYRRDLVPMSALAQGAAPSLGLMGLGRSGPCAAHPLH